MRKKNPDVVIVGGGIIGLTTALCLELVGYTTVIYTASVPFVDEQKPSIATPYAAASIKPSSVSKEGLRRTVAHSQRYFGLLSESGSMGVRRQPHFVLHERDVEDPDYAEVVDDFKRVSELAEYPRRQAAEKIFGWRFEAYFAEMPVYVRRSYDLYSHLGGTIYRRKLSSSDLRDLPGDVIVNCAGFSAPDLCSDPRPQEAHAGHQVIVRGQTPIRNSDGEIFSYNYYPDPEAIDPKLVGEVYAYPRMNELVLGGSRIPYDPSTVSKLEDQIEGAVLTIDDVSVPERIVTVNQKLLDAYRETPLRDEELSARYGLRPVRDPDDEGVRIESEQIDGRHVIHNYGHGGAGVTLSWGSAVEVASMISERIDPTADTVEESDQFPVVECLSSLTESALNT